MKEIPAGEWGHGTGKRGKARKECQEAWPLWEILGAQNLCLMLTPPKGQGSWPSIHPSLQWKASGKGMLEIWGWRGVVLQEKGKETRRPPGAGATRYIEFPKLPGPLKHMEVQITLSVHAYRNSDSFSVPSSHKFLDVFIETEPFSTTWDTSVCLLYSWPLFKE